MTIEVVPSDSCPACLATLTRQTTLQDALFVHGGYGATTRTVISQCPECGWSLVNDRSEVRPPRSSYPLDAQPHDQPRSANQR